jgi:methyl-accepting chemotaxis protein WspA
MFTLSPLFKNQALQIRSLLTFIAIGLIIVSVAILSFRGTTWLSQSFNSLANDSAISTVALWKINDGQIQIQLSESLLLNPDLNSIQKQQQLSRITTNFKQVDEGLKVYRELERSPEERQLYREFQERWDKWNAAHQQFIQAYTQLQPAIGATASRPAKEKATPTSLDALNQQWLVQNLPVSLQLMDSMKELISENAKFVNLSKQETVTKVERLKFWVLGGLAIGLLITVGLGFYFSQMVAKPLNSKLAKVIGQVHDTSLHVNTSATQIASSSRELEATFTQQVASTNQVVSQAKKIAATSKELVKTMENVTDMSQETAEAAVNSQQDLQTMKSTMNQLAKATGGISSKLDLIREKANNISTVVTTITKVADQTNLLSLNAAIEAEKAGEFGQGFSVVSREIRRLADQTAVATLEIDSMVREMQSAVASGVMEMDKFTNEVERGAEDVRKISMQIAHTIKKVQSLTPHFQMVNQGMEQQSHNAEQISESMMQLGEASNQTANALREINIVLEQLNDTAGYLRNDVSNLQGNN